MRTVAIAIALAACATQGPARPARGVAFATWRTAITPLEVIVLDDYPTRDSCEGVAARRIEIAVDGVPKATLEVPCSTLVHSPPRQLAAPRVDVPAGKHSIRVREIASGLEATAELVLPIVEPPFGAAEDDDQHELATKLPVWANADELELLGVRFDLSTL